ncbi:hypothetical protein PsorP6_013563 [Peronosclerospora sorghi]|uniref:Uncharacterized protein n=1 Tax=Peronosclerospora sorghi TaxID=230839 RepID=A0ACC0VFV5_9STRA|nr:hypothetical protein PsorP6_013563 [Peronosclerospora sorghi]
MGLTRKNVRAVVHFHLPSSVEACVQQIGRAGRYGSFLVAQLASRVFRPGGIVNGVVRLINAVLPDVRKFSGDTGTCIFCSAPAEVLSDFNITPLSLSCKWRRPSAHRPQMLCLWVRQHAKRR